MFSPVSNPTTAVAMQSRTRTFKMLVFLALSMTACAGLLGWLEPKVLLTNLGADPVSARQRAESLVADGLSHGGRRWRGVNIDAMPDTGTLAAASDSSLDFFVTREGDIQAGAAWTRRAAAGEPGVAVHIGVEGAESDRWVPSIAQCVGLHALLAALIDRGLILADSTGVDLRSGNGSGITGGAEAMIRKAVEPLGLTIRVP